MQVVHQKISITDLKEMSKKMSDNLVKAVVDIEKEVMVVDAEMHCDEESFLLEQDSQQEYLWGINLYPALFGHEKWIEFDSMINLRPSWGNRTRGVDDPKIQQKIRTIVHKLVSL
ncbi:MAG: DUF5674 family protein [Candidatus Babeliaceae bacterium]